MVYKVVTVQVRSCLLLGELHIGLKVTIQSLISDYFLFSSSIDKPMREELRSLLAEGEIGFITASYRRLAL